MTQIPLNTYCSDQWDIKPTSLVNSLDEFTRAEILSGDNSIQCCICDKLTPTTKQMTLETCPAVTLLLISGPHASFEKILKLKMGPS